MKYTVTMVKEVNNAENPLGATPEVLDLTVEAATVREARDLARETQPTFELLKVRRIKGTQETTAQE